MSPPTNARFRVLHTADWHLGKMLGEQSREEEHRHFLKFLLEAIREQQVDLLLIAGDVFDSANRRKPRRPIITTFFQPCSDKVVVR